jgi:hypothetical protein
MPAPLRRTRSDLALLIHSILASRGLSLAEIARQSGTHFRGNPLFRIVPNFCDAVRRPSFTPSLHQVYALSVLTGYRLADWLSLFGISFDDGAQFQAAWSQRRTAELDARIYDRKADISWFEETQSASLGAELTPLRHWLTETAIRPLDSLSSKLNPSFRYLKIGSDDAYSFPDLLPGSIVRVDGRLPAAQLLAKEGPRHLFAIEHERGVLCSRLRAGSRGRVVLYSRQLPYAPAEFELGTEARILGFVDLEIRRLTSQERPEVSATAGRVWKPEPLRTPPPRGHVGECIRRARHRSALSFREASERTAEIARLLGHRNYFCAASALSDMETRDLFPRHIHKLVSLSAVYCVSVADLAGLAGLSFENTGQEAMPDEWNRASHLPAQGRLRSPSSFLQAVEKEFEEIPFFLRRALPAVLGLPRLSIRDLFWAGATGDLPHPYLRNAAFLAVNRKNKTPAPSLSSPVWAQPLYVLQLRNGKRLCAACALQDGTLIVRPCTTASGDLLRLRNGADAEVLGQVVAVARRLYGPNGEQLRLREPRMRPD